ncbi:MAG: M20/M25/M40 family metallo-hydrolase [Acidobacteria bacterium]|nr:M20/M25/M40 family metallo-hydrolase [Acidobacteriota bacterium]
MQHIQISNAELREAVAAEAPGAFELLAALVARPSLRGSESAAQELMASTMLELGFDVERLAIPDSIGDDDLAGVPAYSYEGRFDVVGRMPHDGGRSLLLNGHIDAVPANEATWSSDPFVPVIRDGWLYGRGAGDMKGGFSMAVLALRALRRLGANAGQRNLSFLSVIEEEYTGNGTLAAVRAGVSADAVVLPEPTNLKILLGGVAITWVRIIIRFGGGHAESSDRIAAPAQVVSTLIGALEHLEEEYNKELKPPFDAIARPYNVNVGVIRLGEWPSSVAAVAELEIRVGHPDDVNDEQVRATVHAIVADALRDTDGPEFEVALHGFKAQAYHLVADHPLVHDVVRAHVDVHGEAPSSELLGSTTDARYYVNQLGVPALCFGPVVRNMHGSNESVELASIEAGALTLARFLLNYFNEGGS